MNIIAIGVALIVVLILVLVISSLISSARRPTDAYYRPDDGMQNIHHAGYPGQAGSAETNPQAGGAWGGRDMGSDHHSHSDSGGGGDGGGGDTGGGADSGGGGGG